MEHTKVNIGTMHVTNAQNKLVISIMGNRIIITLFDYTNKIGAMAHPIKEPHELIDKMLFKMLSLGSSASSIKAKLVCGRRLMPNAEIFPRDVFLEAREKLKQKGIEITAECFGQDVEFCTKTGVLDLEEKI